MRTRPRASTGQPRAPTPPAPRLLNCRRQHRSPQTSRPPGTMCSISGRGPLLCPPSRSRSALTVRTLPSSDTPVTARQRLARNTGLSARASWTYWCCAERFSASRSAKHKKRGAIRAEATCLVWGLASRTDHASVTTDQ